MKKATRNLVSRPSLQPLFLRLLKLCHAAMNYGGGQTVSESGEIGALKFARATLGRSASPFILFDVGANDGGYLQCALPVLGADVRAFSFEPQSAAFEKLGACFRDDQRVVLRRL